MGKKAGPATSVLAKALIVMKTCMNRTQLYFPLETSRKFIMYLMDILIQVTVYSPEEAKIHESRSLLCVAI